MTGLASDVIAPANNLVLPPIGSDPAPALTIGLAVYNNARTLRRAIESLLAQTYRDFVLIVSDDCSRDDSASIARE